MSVRLRTKCLWVRIPLQSLKLQILCLFPARSSLTLRQLQCRFTLKCVCNMIKTHSLRWVTCFSGLCSPLQIFSNFWNYALHKICNKIEQSKFINTVKWRLSSHYYFSNNYNNTHADIIPKSESKREKFINHMLMVRER